MCMNICLCHTSLNCLSLDYWYCVKKTKINRRSIDNKIIFIIKHQLFVAIRSSVLGNKQKEDKKYFKVQHSFNTL